MLAHARISLDALRHNLSRVRQLADGARVMSVIKANAYGHGLPETAEALGGSDAFAVANIDEASRLRSHFPDKKIVILQGVISQEALSLACKLNLDVVIHHEQQLLLLQQAKLSEALSVWLKVDTGMHRLGLPAEQLAAAIDRLQGCSNELNISLMSHFANADDQSDPLTEQQFGMFEQLTGQYNYSKSIANSAGILAKQDYHLDWVRPGIMLYGVNPFTDGMPSELQLQPVMTLTATIIAIQHFSKGDRIGYGGTWTCPEDMPVAVIAIGYGDGYPRHAQSGTPVLINGTPCPLVGRVSMDMICVDIRQAASARVGDPVVLWGEGLPIEVVAEHSNTIAYELLCKITGRVQREYS